MQLHLQIENLPARASITKILNKNIFHVELEVAVYWLIISTIEILILIKSNKNETQPKTNSGSML